MPMAHATWTRRVFASPSAEANSLPKKRSRKWRTRTRNSDCCSLSTELSRARTESESTASRDTESVRCAGSMRNPHDFDHLARGGLSILLAHQLRKDLFEAGQLHQPREVGGCRIGNDLALRDYDHAIAELLDDFEHVRDIEDRFAGAGKFVQQVPKQAR